jgi:hypothetical protein
MQIFTKTLGDDSKSQTKMVAKRRSVMWMIVTVVALLFLSGSAMLSTLFVIIMLNGYPSLPDGIVILYGCCAFGLLPVLSLASGFTSKKINEISAIPTWLAGIALIIIANVIVPFVLIGFTFVLLAAFGML